MNDGVGVVDPNTPSIARVYDYLLGGKDNYPADRKIGNHFMVELPGSVSIAFGNRQALARAVRDIARSGVKQFIDLGSGLPTADNVHQIAARYTDGAKVVYVDNDPTVLAHGRALLAGDARTTVLGADVRNSEKIRHSEEVRRLIDFGQPVAIVLSAVLHHLNDDEDPGGIVSYWYDRIPSGSQVFLSHFRSGGNAETEAAEQKLQSTFGRGRWRTDAEIRELFGELELLEPGIVPAALWRPDDSDAADAPRRRTGSEERNLTVWDQLIAAGLARKP